MNREYWALITGGLFLIFVIYILYLEGISNLIKKKVWDTLAVIFIPLLIILSFAFAYTFTGLYNRFGKWTDDFYTCLYFSTNAFVSLSYSDFIPTPESRILVSIEALLGYITMGVIIGLIFYFLSRIKN